MDDPGALVDWGLVLRRVSAVLQHGSILSLGVTHGLVGTMSANGQLIIATVLTRCMQ
jgi:hypothetical protein